MFQENLSDVRQDHFIAEPVIGSRHVEAAIGAIVKEEQLRLSIHLRTAMFERSGHLDLI
jgi:hypothetical protein